MRKYWWLDFTNIFKISNEKKNLQGENESKPIKILGKNSKKWYDKTEDFFFIKEKERKMKNTGDGEGQEFKKMMK